MNFRQFFIISASTFLVSTIAAPIAVAADKKNERWFEMEVILFSQLDDKTKLQEAFSEKIPLPKYKKVWDLLTPYLNPDIADLKQQLPSCDNPQYPATLIKQQIAELDPFYQTKSLEELKLLSKQEYQSYFNPYAVTPTNNQLESVNDEADLVEQEAPDNNFADIDNELAIPTLTAEEIALVAQAEQTFTDYPLTQIKDSVAFELCQQDKHAYTQLTKGLDNVSYYGFTVQQVPKRIDAVEDVYSNKPYLISSDSLKLKDIVTQLRRSKNFRPLLHLGWRQAPKGRNQASAVKIFAGDNFDAYYQDQIANYQDAIAASEAQEALLSDILQTASNDQQTTTQPEILSAAQQRQLVINNLIAQLDNVPTDTEQLLELIDKPVLQLPLSNNESIDTSLMLMEQPAKVPQPWYIDGLFKVHLNHYLYITADFNILNMDLAKYATESLKAEPPTELTPIRFQQNRRVISGEIHYFDHPYVGMIVQIRRHKRPEPPQQETIVSD